jgi:hypothetical protein
VGAEAEERPARRRLAERVYQMAVGVSCLLSRHLLEDDRWHEGFEDRTCLRNPNAADLSVQSCDEWVHWDKARVVVLFTAQRRRVRDSPLRAGPPGLDVDAAVVVFDSRRRGALRGAGGAPDRSALMPERGATPKRPQCQPKIQRAARLEQRSGIR